MSAPQAPMPGSPPAPAGPDAASDTPPGALVGRSAALRRALALLERVAATDATLLLQGETGTGKSAAARHVHQLSRRAAGPLVVLDCASVSAGIIESELFGHERGAFTGAVAQHTGCLERAHGGTLFLDEVDELAPELQPKLLRALEVREFTRLGGEVPVRFDARLVAASKGRLWTRVKQGRFREDLYFRLSVFTVELPPLRERPEDVPVLVDALAGAPLWAELPEAVRERLLGHPWPGNVRELRNAVERARLMAAGPGGEVAGGVGTPEGWLPEGSEPVAPPGADPDVLPVDFSGPYKQSKDALLRRFEREYLTRLLARAGGNVARAARAAGLDRKHLYSLLHKHGLVQGEAE